MVDTPEREVRTEQPSERPTQSERPAQSDTTQQSDRPQYADVNLPATVARKAARRFAPFAWIKFTISITRIVPRLRRSLALRARQNRTPPRGPAPAPVISVS